MSPDRLGSTAHGVALALLSGLCVGAWAAHVFALTSLARLDQLHPDVIWIMQGVTVMTAVPCLATIGIGWLWLRETSTPEDEGSPTGRTVFLCWMAIFVGLFNLALIVLESIFVAMLPAYV
jgi:hypothetical protein